MSKIGGRKSNLFIGFKESDKKKKEEINNAWKMNLREGLIFTPKSSNNPANEQIIENKTNKIYSKMTWSDKNK